MDSCCDATMCAGALGQIGAQQNIPLVVAGTCTAEAVPNLPWVTAGAAGFAQPSEPNGSP